IVGIVEPAGVEHAQTLLPEELAIAVVAVKAFRAERGEDMAAVGRRRRVGVAALRVAFDLGHARAGRLFPDDLAAALVYTVDPPGVLRRFLDRIDVTVQARFEIGLAVAADRRGDVNAVFPDDRAGVAEAGDWRLPADVEVLLHVPGERRKLAVGDPGG